MTASLILRKLGSYPHQHSLALALREIGRMERTLFTLEWLRDRAQTARDCRTQGEAKSLSSHVPQGGPYVFFVALRGCVRPSLHGNLIFLGPDEDGRQEQPEKHAMQVPEAWRTLG